MDKPNIALVDIRSSPVTYLVFNGFVLTDETVHEAEVIALATGLEAVTAGLRDIDMNGLEELHFRNDRAMEHMRIWA